MNFNEYGLAPPPLPPTTSTFFARLSITITQELCLEIFDKSISSDFQFASDTTGKRTLSLFNNLEYKHLYVWGEV